MTMNLFDSLAGNEARQEHEQTARFLQRFFKTGPGQYGEGDIFLGIRVPVLRKLANQYRTVSQKEILTLLKSPIHETRLFALLIVLRSFAKADEFAKGQIYNFYLAHTRYINNWDLVDVLAPSIVGLFDGQEQNSFIRAGEVA